MSQRYDAPDLVARTANTVIRWLAEAGLSIAGTRAMRVRGRRTGRQHEVVVNLMTVDGVDYLVSPRGNTQWARNARAAGVVEAKPPLLARYLDRWYWEVKGHVGGLTPRSAQHELRAAAPSIPVFALSS